MSQEYDTPYFQGNQAFKSKFHLFSIGIVAENKPMSSNRIRVVPIELIPMLDGEIVEAIDEYEVSGRDRNDEPYTVSIKAGSTIKATWLQLGSNRRTAPDVRRGERVLIWRFADQDRYYWQEMGLDDDMRRLETVIYAFSAEKEDNTSLKLDENCYTLEVSTHRQHITLKTTDAEGEATTYRLQFNLADGVFFLEDKQGNSVSINSVEHQIQARTTDECQVTLDKEDLLFEVPRNVAGRVGKNVDLEIGGNFTGVIKKNADLKVGGNVTGLVEGDIDWETKGNVRHQAPKMQFGMNDAVQPSTLGDNMATAMQALITQLNQSYVIGNLGAPTSVIQGGSGPVEQTGGDQLLPGGDVYSTVNTNQ